MFHVKHIKFLFYIKLAFIGQIFHNIHMKKFTSKTQKVGELGENLAVKYLKNKGFSIIERNFTFQGGEIDIIAEQNNNLFFVEVKTRNYKNTPLDKISEYKPEENVTSKKRERFEKTVALYESSHDMEKYESINLVCMAVYISGKDVRVDMIDF